MRPTRRCLALLLTALFALLAGPAAPRPAAAAGPFAYITNGNSNNVSVIDTIPNADSYPDGVAVNPGGTRVYITNLVDVSVSVIDTSTNTIVATVPLGGNIIFPLGVAVNPAGTRVYVASALHVSVIDTGSSSVVATVSGVNGGTSLAVNPSGSRIYVSSGLDNSILVIDTSSNTIVATVPGIHGGGIAVNPAGTRLYVANGNNLAVIDTSSDALVASVPVGNTPIGVAVNPAGTRVYVANDASNSVSVIDTSSNTVIATVPAGQGPFGVSVTSDGSRVYVANRSSNNVSVINAFTNTVVATVPVGLSPSAFGQFIQPAGGPKGTAVSLFSTQNPASFGAPVTFTAAVIAFAGVSPSGTVSFFDNGAPLGAAPVIPAAGSGSPSAQFTASTLLPGTHTITAAYSGDSTYGSSGSQPLAQVVLGLGTGTTLTSSQNPSALGQSVTFTATVTCPGFTPAGSVTFTDLSPAIGTPTQLGVVPLGNVGGQQQATFTTANLGAGNHPIVAGYDGDTNCAPSLSSVLAQNVQAAAVSTTVTLSAQPNPFIPGQAVTLSATVSDGTPDGTVTFLLDGSPLATVALDSSGTASMSTGPLTGAAHTLVAVYSGDATHPSSQSAVLTLQPQALTLILSGFTLTLNASGCGSVSPPSENGVHLFGDTMLLTAVPCAGSSFVGWQGGPCDGTTINPCGVAMPPNNLTITAVFQP